jgi:hypothetical protein
MPSRRILATMAGKRATMLVVAMNSDRSRMRRMSMYGAALFALGVMTAIASVATGSVWLVGAAVILLAPGAVMLYRVGKSLS